MGGVAVVLNPASWGGKARFSTTSWRWPPQRKGKSRSRWSRRVIIGLGLSLDQSRQINQLAAGRGFGEGQAPHDGAAVRSAALDLGSGDQEPRPGEIILGSPGRHPIERKPRPLHP